MHCLHQYIYLSLITSFLLLLLFFHVNALLSLLLGVQGQPKEGVRFQSFVCLQIVRAHCGLPVQHCFLPFTSSFLLLFIARCAAPVNASYKTFLI